jgi:DNA-binding transcriptional regulator YhcF (GntR family)
MFEEKIQAGSYAVGAQLPTVRELAQQLGVNKNTVVRAYQALEQKGYLELVRGSGAFVRNYARQLPQDSDGTPWQAQIEHAFKDAKQQAVSREVILQKTLHSLDATYGKQQSRVAFVECNRYDIETLGAELTAATGVELIGVLLGDVLANPAEIAARFDLVATTFYHLGEVSQTLKPWMLNKVVGVHAMPTHDALLNIARLHVSVIGLVCELPTTLDNLTHIIHTYHPSVTILSTLIDDKPRLDTLLDKADAIVVARSGHTRLMELNPQVPIVTVSFTIDQQSLDFLRKQIQDETNNHLEMAGNMTSLITENN